MFLRWLVAALHLLALGIGLGSIHVRARGLLAGTPEGLKTALVADGYWGAAAALWLLTGLWRAFGGLEKGTAYYLQEPVFQAKMGVFLLIWLLELWPMIALIRWRIAMRRGESPDTSRAALFGWVSHVEAALVVLLVVLATAMARGVPLFR